MKRFLDLFDLILQKNTLLVHLFSRHLVHICLKSLTGIIYFFSWIIQTVKRRNHFNWGMLFLDCLCIHLNFSKNFQQISFSGYFHSGKDFLYWLFHACWDLFSRNIFKSLENSCRIQCFSKWENLYFLLNILIRILKAN